MVVRIKPISFAGPFITPITNVGQTQSGYGPALGGTISAEGSSVVSVPEMGARLQEFRTLLHTPAKVILTHSVSGTGSSDPSQEYLGLEVSDQTTQGINISWLEVVSTVTGASATIPQGVQCCGLAPWPATYRRSRRTDGDTHHRAFSGECIF